MALVGLIESLLTLTVIDQITETRGDARRECFGQSLGNLVSSLFGLQGGCAVVGQSLLNVSVGGRGRISSFTNAVCLLLSATILGPIVGEVPTAALAGIMFLVALNTFCWGALRLLHQMDFMDAFVIFVVTVLAVTVDLATAVIVGLCLSAIAFAWRAAQEARIEEAAQGDVFEFRLHGPLFFASAMSYQSKIEVGRINEKTVVLDFSQGQVLDHSGLDAIAKVCDRLIDAGKQVMQRGLPQEAEEALSYMVTRPMVGIPSMVKTTEAVSAQPVAYRTAAEPVRVVTSGAASPVGSAMLRTSGSPPGSAASVPGTGKPLAPGRVMKQGFR